MTREIGRVYKITNEFSNRDEAMWYVCMDLVDALHGDFVDEYNADAYGVRWDYLEEANMKEIDERTQQALLRRVFGDHR